MVAVTETAPGTQPSINQKSDSQAVPSGQDDLWVDAGDMNILGADLVAYSRAFRATALVTGVGPATAGITDKAFRFVTIDASSGLGRASTSFATDLNKNWAAAVESIEGNGGSLSGTASNTGFFGVYAGTVSGTSGTFTTNTLYGLSAGGGLVSHVSGALPPIAIGLDAKTAYVDMGGRTRADDSTLEYNISGVLRVKSGAQFTLGDTDINGTLTVSGTTTLSGATAIQNTLTVSGTTTLSGGLDVAGATVLSGSLRVTGAATFSGTVTLENGLTVQGALNADTSYRMGGTTVIDSSRNLTNIVAITASGTTALSGLLNIIGQPVQISGVTAIGSDRSGQFAGITLDDATNIVLNATTGTKIGTATSQKLGFYDATPVDQPATVADPAGGGTVDAEARTAINTLIDRLQELGLIA